MPIYKFVPRRRPGPCFGRERPAYETRPRPSPGNSITLALLPAFLLTPCSHPDEKPDNRALAKVEANGTAEAADDGLVSCALAGGRGFTRSCSVDREQSSSGLLLTIRHPDGGFHRLLVTKDGRGVVAADGAQPAKVSVLGDDEIEVAIGRDSYRLPATVRTHK